LPIILDKLIIDSFEYFDIRKLEKLEKFFKIF